MTIPPERLTLLDALERLAVNLAQATSTLEAIVAHERRSRIAVHDGSEPGSPCLRCSDEPPPAA
jgi:hypothetical protein